MNKKTVEVKRNYCTCEKICCVSLSSPHTQSDVFTRRRKKGEKAGEGGVVISSLWTPPSPVFRRHFWKLSTESSTVYEIDVFPCTPQKRWWSRKRWCPSKITAFTAFYTFSRAVLKKCYGWLCSRSQNCRVLCREACKNCLNWSPNRPTSRFFGVRSDRVHDAKPPVQNQNPGSDLDGCLKLCTRPCIFWGGILIKLSRQFHSPDWVL